MLFPNVLDTEAVCTRFPTARRTWNWGLIGFTAAARRTSCFGWLGSGACSASSSTSRTGPRASSTPRLAKASTVNWARNATRCSSTPKRRRAVYTGRARWPSSVSPPNRYSSTLKRNGSVSPTRSSARISRVPSVRAPTPFSAR